VNAVSPGLGEVVPRGKAARNGVAVKWLYFGCKAAVPGAVDRRFQLLPAQGSPDGTGKGGPTFS